MVGRVGYGELDLNGELRPASGDQTTAGQLRGLLDGMEPGGPAGDVVLGYTLPLPLLRLYSRQGGNWALDPRKLGFYLDIIRQVDRPVVVALLANHFSPTSPLVTELVNDPANTMTMGNGESPRSVYFSTDVQPFTLSPDLDIPVNRYRYEAMGTVLDALTDINETHPERVRAVTLFGEVHHLFADLKGGTGKFEGVQFTDYSPRSQAAFRRWLQDRFEHLDWLNAAALTPFAHWPEVTPPSKDIRLGGLKAFYEHIDAYASGKLPVFGWLDDRLVRPRIEVYLNGNRVGLAQTGLDRLDVYENVPEIATPNIGYRYELDYRALPAGRHRVDVVLRPEQGPPVRLGHRDLVVFHRNQATPQRDWRRAFRERGVMTLERSGFRGWLDHPKADQDLYYNPWAHLWQRFREDQVEHFIRTTWERAVQTGFAADRLFSHQLSPEKNGSWNRMIFAADLSNLPASPYQKGFTLYGGGAFSSQVHQRAGGRPFGVPEMNPLMGKNPQSPMDALLFQQRACAEFVSPYFLDIPWKIPKGPSDGHETMLLHPLNTHKGANHYLQAIGALVAR